MISARSPGSPDLREVAKVDHGVALAGDTLVELDDHVGEGGPLSPHRSDGVGDLVEVVELLLPERMTDTLLGEQATATGLRAEVDEPWIRTVHGDPQGNGDVTLEFGRVVGDEMGQRAIRDERGDPAQEPGSLEQLLTERSGRPVADGDERQAGACVAGDHAGQQRQVVLDDRGGNRCRRDVDHAQARLAEQQEQEEEALLVGLHQTATAVAEAIECHRRDDHHRLVLDVQSHRVPHGRHVALEAIEVRVPLLVGERRTG